MTKGYLNLVIAVVVVWMLTIGLIFFAPTPFKDLGGDLVEPQKVKAGGIVVVTRSYEIMRDSPIVVTRKMFKGDCRVSCEFLDLTTSHLTLTPGVYRSVKREHIIPANAAVGKWSLQFTIHWHGMMGREYHYKLKDLEI